MARRGVERVARRATTPGYEIRVKDYASKDIISVDPCLAGGADGQAPTSRLTQSSLRRSTAFRTAAGFYPWSEYVLAMREYSDIVILSSYVGSGSQA